MNIITRLKNNTAAFGLMDEELRKAAEEIGIRQFLIFDGIGGPGWTPAASQRFCIGASYRLHPDYACTHPEAEKGEAK